MTSHTLQGFESLQWHPGGAGDELKQSGSPFLIVRFHGPPKPLHTVTLGRAMLQSRVGLPVVDVDLTESTHDELRGTLR